MSQVATPAYERIVLKLSGEALLGQADYGVDPTMLGRLAREVHDIARLGVETALVIGGGNIFRGTGLASEGMDRVTADQMGMLATVMNALAMQDALERLGAEVRVLSAVRINQVCEDYIRRRAVRHLEKGRICVFAAGTGNPFFTTDTAATLRAIEIGATLMLKATKVDGVYSADPVGQSGLTRYGRLSYDEILDRQLEVMDATAIVMCRDNDLPLRVFDINQSEALQRIVCGDDSLGTMVDNGLPAGGGQ